MFSILSQYQVLVAWLNPKACSVQTQTKLVEHILIIQSKGSTAFLCFAHHPIRNWASFGQLLGPTWLTPTRWFLVVDHWRLCADCGCVYWLLRVCRKHTVVLLWLVGSFLVHCLSWITCLISALVFNKTRITSLANSTHLVVDTQWVFINWWQAILADWIPVW